MTIHSIFWLCFQVSSVQSLSHVWLFAALHGLQSTPWTAALQASLSITNSQSWLKLMSIKSVMPSNHLFLCCPLVLQASIFPIIEVFSYESVLRIRCQNIGVSASESVLPMNIHGWLPLGWPAWISLLSKGLSRVFSNTTVQKHQFFSAQLLYSPTLTSTHDFWKTKALTKWTFVGKVMSLLYNMLCRLVIIFLPRSKCLLISWLQSPSAVILEPSKNGLSLLRD